MAHFAVLLWHLVDLERSKVKDDKIAKMPKLFIGHNSVADDPIYWFTSATDHDVVPLMPNSRAAYLLVPYAANVFVLSDLVSV